MADKVNREARSRIMAKVPSRDSKPEMTVRRRLYSEGFRYRLHCKSLPGTPDIVLPRFHVAIFVNGCFWHGTIAPISENRKPIEIIGRVRLDVIEAGISVMKRNFESLDGESTLFGNAPLRKEFVSSWAF